MASGNIPKPYVSSVETELITMRTSFCLQDIGLIASSGAKLINPVGFLAFAAGAESPYHCLHILSLDWRPCLNLKDLLD